MITIIEKTCDGYSFIFSYYKNIRNDQISKLPYHSLVASVRLGNKEAEEEIISRFIDKIYAIVCELYDDESNISIDDLLQVGILAFIEHIREMSIFPVNFNTSCFQKIEQAIRKYVKNNKFEIKEVIDEGLTVEEIVQTKIDSEYINYCIDNILTEQERYIIRNHYGFVTGDKITFIELGNELNKSPKTIHQSNRKALWKLRSHLIRNWYNLDYIRDPVTPRDHSKSISNLDQVYSSNESKESSEPFYKITFSTPNDIRLIDIINHRALLEEDNSSNVGFSYAEFKIYEFLYECTKDNTLPKHNFSPSVEWIYTDSDGNGFGVTDEQAKYIKAIADSIDEELSCGSLRHISGNNFTTMTKINL